MISIANLQRVIYSAVAMAFITTAIPDVADAATGAERRAAAAAKRAAAQAEAEARRSGDSIETSTPTPTPPPPPEPVNTPPTISGSPRTSVELGSPYFFRPTAGDVDGDDLTFSIGGKPSWAQFNPGTGQLSGTPTANSHVGTTGSIWISVSDGEAAANLRSFMITVTAPPAPEPLPPVESPVTPPPADGLVSVALPSAYRWDRLQPGKPVYVDRNYTFVAVPPSLAGWRYLQTENDDKYVSDPARVRFDATKSVRVVVGYDRRIAALPGWLQSWKPADVIIKTSDANFIAYYRDFPAGSVTLGGNENGFSNYTVAVEALDAIVAPSPPSPPPPTPQEPINVPPTISGTPLASVQLGSLYSFTPAADDNDGDTLTFTIVNKPRWAQFDKVTGRLRGTPNADSDVGTTGGIRISVSDGRAGAGLPMFSITVTPKASAPPVTEPPATEPPVTEPPPSQNDPQADGLVSGTQPLEYRWGTLAVGEKVYIDRNYTFVRIPQQYFGFPYLQTENNDKYVSDPDSVSFAVTTPVRVIVAYDRRISVLPAWLQQWTQTGVLIETTDAKLLTYYRDFPAGAVTLGGNENGYSNYTVIVAPVGEIEELPAPPTEPEPTAPAGSVLLSWDAPTLNEDGTTLGDLAGFRVRYGRSAGQWQFSKKLNDPDRTTHLVEGLASGEWYFTVTAFDFSGNESREADIVSTVIQ